MWSCGDSGDECGEARGVVDDKDKGATGKQREIEEPWIRGAHEVGWVGEGRELKQGEVVGKVLLLLQELSFLLSKLVDSFSKG